MEKAWKGRGSGIEGGARSNEEESPHNLIITFSFRCRKHSINTRLTECLFHGTELHLLKTANNRYIQNQDKLLHSNTAQAISIYGQDIIAILSDGIVRIFVKERSSHQGQLLVGRKFKFKQNSYLPPSRFISVLGFQKTFSKKLIKLGRYKRLCLIGATA